MVNEDITLEPGISYKMSQAANKIIAIGASTGGPEALKQILLTMPLNSPGILIAQHMPPKFTSTFAARLNRICRMIVKEACDGDLVKNGEALIAPGNFHMILKRRGSHYIVKLTSGPMLHHQRPSADILFKSVAQSAGPNALGIILTGMGADGAEGLLNMKMAGAKTIAQDEKSCVVFGMPKEAIKAGGVDKVISLKHIAHTALKMI